MDLRSYRDLGISIEEISSFEGLLSLEKEWNSLLCQSDSNSIFLTFEWVTTWWKHFGRDKKLFVLLVKDGQKIIGIVPWMIRKIWKKSDSLNKIEFIGTGLTPWEDFILTERKNDSLRAIITYLQSKSNRWTVADLRNVYSSSGNIEILMDILSESGLICEKGPDSLCPYIPIESSWESFYSKRFSKKHRKMRRKEFRRLQSRGDIRFRIVNDLSDDPDIMNKIAELEQVRSYKKGPQGLGLFGDEKLKSFFFEIASIFSRKRWLSIALLELDGNPIVYRFGFQYGQKYSSYNTAYDQSYAYYSPGRVLVGHLIEWCHDLRMQEFDFLRGMNSFKSEWTDNSRQNVRLGVFKRDVYSMGLNFLYWKVRPLLHRTGINFVTKQSYYNFLRSS